MVVYPNGDHVGVYTRRQRIWAVLMTGLWGWAVVALPAPLVHMVGGRAAQGINLLFLFAVFGLPVALVVSGIFVAPILKVMMRRRVSYCRAMLWGGGTAAVLAALSIVVGRFRGWKQSQDPTFYSQIGGGDYIRSIDGILTPYGWWVTVQNSAFFVLACIFGAVVIRLIIGPGRNV